MNLQGVPLDKLSTVCRLCLSVSDKLFNLFRSNETEALAIPLSMKVSLCTATTVSKHDMLPQKICLSCRTYVNEWFTFRNNCKKTNAFLKQHIASKINIENGEKESVVKENVPEYCTSNENLTKEVQTLTTETCQLLKTSEVQKEGAYCISDSYVPKNCTSNENLTIEVQTLMEVVGTRQPLKTSEVEKEGAYCISDSNVPKNCTSDENITKEVQTLMEVVGTHQLLKETSEVQKGGTDCISDSSAPTNFTSSDHKLRSKKATYGDTFKEPNTRWKKFECSICSDSFYFLKHLKLHMSVAHDSTYSSNALVKDPTKTKSNSKPAGLRKQMRFEKKCCGELFYNKVKYTMHFAEKHPGEKPFKCEICGKKGFISERTLRRHKVLHTEKHRCHICSKTFTCNASLVLHRRDKHDNDKPFVCDACGKRFVTKLLMSYHMRTHTGEKKYVCDECGLAVVNSSSLAKHKRIHTKERPHVCEICGKGFIVKGRLAEHLRMHSGERPYACEICKKAFTLEEKLKKHVLIHFPKRFFCEYCGNKYSTKYGLSFHLKSHKR